MAAGVRSSGGKAWNVGKVVLVTGVARQLAGRFVRRIQRDPEVDRVVAVDAVMPEHDLGGADFVQALCDAAQRGVAVELVLPGRSDSRLALHAGRSYYTQLLRAGVRIHEMDLAVMHAKTAVIDGVFSTVGSSNLDWLSFVANNELNVIVLGEAFGDEMNALFERDRAASRQITPAAWERRGPGSRLMEGVGRLLERWL